MTLLNNNVLIERIAARTVSTQLHIPAGFQLEIENKGRVLDVGPGKLTKRGHRIPCDVEPGDIVTFYELAECHQTRIANQVIISEEKIFFVE